MPLSELYLKKVVLGKWNRLRCLSSLRLTFGFLEADEVKLVRSSPKNKPKPAKPG